MPDTGPLPRVARNIATEVPRSVGNTIATMTVGTLLACKFGLQSKFWPTAMALSGWAGLGVLNPPTYHRHPLFEGESPAARAADFFVRSLGFVGTVAALRLHGGAAAATRMSSAIAYPLAGALVSGAFNPLIDAARPPRFVDPALPAFASGPPYRRAALTAILSGAAAFALPPVFARLSPGTVPWAAAMPKGMILAVTAGTATVVMIEDWIEKRFGMQTPASLMKGLGPSAGQQADPFALASAGLPPPCECPGWQPVRSQSPGAGRAPSAQAARKAGPAPGPMASV